MYMQLARMYIKVVLKFCMMVTAKKMEKKQ